MKYYISSQRVPQTSNQIVFACVITLPLLTLWNSWIALTRKNSIWKSYMLEISIIQGLIKLGDQG